MTAREIFGLIVFVIVLQVAALSSQWEGHKKAYDVCNPDTPVSTPPRTYLPPGETTTVYFSLDPQNGGHRVRCSMAVVTYPSSRIKVKREPVQFGSGCYGSLNSDQCKPGCSYFYLFDGDYKDKRFTAITTSHGNNDFETESRKLHIVACGDSGIISNTTFRMSLRLTAVEKIQTLQENAFDPYQKLSFMSPMFPEKYVLNDEIYTYKFIGSSNHDFITITFEDWLLSPYSELEVEGGNLAGPISGSASRPYIISDGSSMTLTFKTGPNSFSGNYHGFKASARFYGGREEIPSTQTDCGLTRSPLSGGVLSLGTQADGQQRDCIWVLSTPEGFDGMYLKVIRYVRPGRSVSNGEESLVVRSGVLSVDPILLRLLPSHSFVPDYSRQTSQDGFYIRLKGTFYDSQDVEIVYATYFNYCEGSIRSLFTCGNGQCIHESLICDGYDHCGDHSDESSITCGLPTPSGPSSHGSSASMSVSVIIPMVVSIFLVIVICLLIIFIRRCRKLHTSTYRHTHHVRESRRVRTGNPNGNVQMSVTVSSGDHPPSYDEVLQDTPIGHLNMAFSWSTMTQPPSYEEATMPVRASETESGNNQTHSTATSYYSNPVSQSVSRQEHQNRLGLSLDETDYLSSSSSSEDDFRSDHPTHHDSSSLDSDVTYDDPLVPDNFTPRGLAQEGEGSPSRSEVKDDQEEVSHDHGQPRVIKYNRDDEVVQVVLSSPGLKEGRRKRRDKHSSNQMSPQHQQPSQRSGTGDSRDRSRGERPNERRRNNRSVVREREPLSRSSRQRDRSRDESSDGEMSALLSPLEERQGAFRDTGRSPTISVVVRSERPNVETSVQNRSRDNVRSQGDNASLEIIDNDQRTHHPNETSNHWGQEPPSIQRELEYRYPSSGHGQSGHVTSGSRSQSCADLYVPNRRQEDKRYSYAGVGDTSLRPEDQESFGNSFGASQHPCSHEAQSHRLSPRRTAKSHDHIPGHLAGASSLGPHRARSRPGSLALPSSMGLLSPVQESSASVIGNSDYFDSSENQRPFLPGRDCKDNTHQLSNVPGHTYIDNSSRSKVQSKPQEYGSHSSLRNMASASGESYVEEPQSSYSSHSSQKRYRRPSRETNVSDYGPDERYSETSEYPPQEMTSRPSGTPQTLNVSTLPSLLHQRGHSPRNPDDRKSLTAERPLTAMERLMKGHSPGGVKVIDPRSGPERPSSSQKISKFQESVDGQSCGLANAGERSHGANGGFPASQFNGRDRIENTRHRRSEDDGHSETSGNSSSSAGSQALKQCTVDDVFV